LRERGKKNKRGLNALLNSQERRSKERLRLSPTLLIWIYIPIMGRENTRQFLNFYSEVINLTKKRDKIL
jgi:hypothetical protein